MFYMSSVSMKHTNKALNGRIDFLLIPVAFDVSISLSLTAQYSN